MTLPPIIRRPLFGWAALLALPVLALGDGAYSPNQKEYTISKAIPGDQVRPQAAVSSLGGFLVWDDNAITGIAQGVAAQALDSNFNPVGRPFRVNQHVSRDHSSAQVALLSGGGAVFVWQGGALGHENIYARFLSASNTWLTGDVQVNSGAGAFRKSPAVAVQANGNVVVVWGSYNQQSGSSMQDIYAQVFSPVGQKSGAEFLVNQFTPYNQRNPNVAALSNGGFVVTWVSEQQNNPALGSQPAIASLPLGPSVDVYARWFGPDGALTGANTNEFRINADSYPCSSPSIAAAADGSLLVVWAQKDMVQRANGWDILSRTVTGGGRLGSVTRVNTYTVGDQFAPRLATSGGTVCVVWTSMAQDGSWEGVYGQLLGFDGNAIGNELRLNTTTVGRQIHPAVASDGQGRFLGLWSWYTGTPSGLDVFAQQYTSASFTPGPTVANVYTAPASDPFAIITDSSSTSSGGSTTVAGGTTNLPTAGGLALLEPAPSPATNALNLSSIVGSYNGLVWETNVLQTRSSGQITITTAAKPNAAGYLAYSGKVTLGSRSFSFTGQFVRSGSIATNVTITAPSTFLQLQLQANLAGGGQIAGNLVDLASGGGQNWVAAIAADRTVAHAAASKYFTMVVPPVTAAPLGFGYGTVKITQAGAIQWAGVLADGTKVSQKTGISEQGLWPLFASLYGGGGVAVSWMQFATNLSDVSGQFIWIKNGGLASPYNSLYAAGITNSSMVTGWPYVAPTVAAPLLSKSARATFLDGVVAGQPAFTNWFAFNGISQVLSTNKQFKLSVNASSGLFTGSTYDQRTGKNLSFQGVVYQRTNGAGLFPGNTQNGQVFLAPAN